MDMTAKPSLSVCGTPLSFIRSSITQLDVPTPVSSMSQSTPFFTKRREGFEIQRNCEP